MSDDLKQAKEKAARYGAGDAETGSGPAEETDEAKRRSTWEMDQWASFADQRIEEAMRAGAFDDLPGRGKPLRQDDDPYVPGDWRMANKLLKNNDLTPGWISDRSLVMQRIERFRRDLTAAAQERRTALHAAADDAERTAVQEWWADAVTAWADEVEEINRQILTVNLQLPTVRLELFALRLDEELSRLRIAD